MKLLSPHATFFQGKASGVPLKLGLVEKRGPAPRCPLVRLLLPKTNYTVNRVAAAAAATEVASCANAS